MVGGHDSRQKRQYSSGAPSRTRLAGVCLPTGARGHAGSGAPQALWAVRVVPGNASALDGDCELTVAYGGVTLLCQIAACLACLQKALKTSSPPER